MNKAKNFLSKLIYNKFLWQFFLAIFMLLMAIFFIRQQHLEFAQIRQQLNNSNGTYILLGIILTIIYVLAQAQMYVHSFKALHKNISLFTALILFLKRNLVSLFLPAGGFTSLAFFTTDLEEKGISKSKIYLASTLYGFCGILSVIFVALPVLAFALHAPLFWK